MLDWDEVDPYATWPEERYRAVSGKHEYRIFLDPEGDHIFPEPDARKVEWWALVIREDMANGVWRHVVHRAERSRAGTAPRTNGKTSRTTKPASRTRTDKMLFPAAFH